MGNSLTSNICIQQYFTISPLLNIELLHYHFKRFGKMKDRRIIIKEWELLIFLCNQANWKREPIDSRIKSKKKRMV